MLSAKQQPSNIEHGGAIRPNVCKLTFGPPCTFKDNNTSYTTMFILFVSHSLKMLPC